MFAVARRVSEFAAGNPVSFTSLTAVLRGFVGDIAAQRIEGAKDFDDIDFRRIILYVGWTSGAMHFLDRPLYTWLMPRIFPSRLNGRLYWPNVVKSVIVDNFIATPFVYYPLFYLWKDCIVNSSHSSTESLQHCCTELPKQMSVCLWYWVPVQAATFSVVPNHLRMGWLGVSSLAWVSILSVTTSQLDKISGTSAPKI